MVYVFLAEGFEEIEALTPVDILRRGGVDTVTVGIGGKNIKGSHGISVSADISDSEFKPDDKTEGIILPGGMPGTLNLEASVSVMGAVSYCADRNILIGAIWVCLKEKMQPRFRRSKVSLTVRFLAILWLGTV